MPADPPALDSRSDAQLLAEFCAGALPEREAAFAELVRRHALMVVNTCRRIVGSSADAEDAGQAVFLTLAHKARTLVRHPTIAGWLHQVARNISIRSRDASRARQRREGSEEASSMHNANDPWTATRREELREVLDAGLERLAERYRLPLVLHYLEGRPQDEVAALLDVPAGTLASLLSRGRDLLRDQLSRQGVAIGVLALGPLLAAEGHASELPSGFAATAAAAAAAIGAGASALSAGASPTAAALSQAALKGMATAKLMVVAAVASVLIVVGGTGLVVTLAAGPPAATSPPTAAVLDSSGATAVAPAPTLVTAPAPPPTAGDAAVAALQARVRALRENDLLALVRLQSPALQAQLEQQWRAGLPGALTVPAMADGLPGMAQSAAGRAQLLPLIAALLMHSPCAQWAHELGALRLPGADAATGAAGAQRAAAADLLAHAAAWLAQLKLDDQAHAATAAQHLVSALAALRCASITEFTRLELPEALTRLGAFQAEIKRAAAVYALEVDVMLDSVRISVPAGAAAVPVPSAPAGGGAGGELRRQLEVAFSAFGGSYRTPVLMLRRDGIWLMIPSMSLRRDGAVPPPAGPPPAEMAF